MNKATLIAKMAEKSDLTKKQAEAALNAFTDTVLEALKEGDKVQMMGFGTFEVKERAARVGRPAALRVEVPDETIDRLLRSKVKPGSDPRRELKRAADSLYRKGFSWSDIKAAVRRFEIDRLSEEDDNGL